MVREVVKIDEEICNGCGICVPGCHEGALQIIDGKARLISDLMCDGLGACLGHCPQGAISIEKREAEEYNETKVMEIMVSKGKNTVIAHLKHLKDHNETGYLREAVSYMKSNETALPFNLQEVVMEVHNYNTGCNGGGCPGSSEREIVRNQNTVNENLNVTAPLIAEVSQDVSELRQWPVQLHLINPQSPNYRNADVLIAADCTAYAVGNFHKKFLAGKSLAIACPKLDSNLESYLNKITAMIDHANINTITVMIMQVPCCSGLLRIVQQAASAAQRKVPIKAIVVSIEGSVLQEQWM
ncbi:MAG TPA: 4Fe-4S dicluster domain-containing protein [Bacteroidales bacterium]|jgi:NAD-dependent dihydropyrimidine dehydrogenase PreA subunit|nr:4Fe-4S dicluster domain-containing protein [Bacteroidales bacterium]